MAEEGMVTSGGLLAESGPSAPSAPSAPPEEATSIYPVLSPQPGQGQQIAAQYQPQQPQQQIYGQPPIYAQSQPQQNDESKQLENDIAVKFDSVIQKLTNKKNLILQECQSANIEQKRDILESLQHLINGIDEIKIDPNIKPKVVPQQLPQQQQLQQQQLQQQQASQKVIIVQQQPQIKQNIKYISDTWNTGISNNLIIFNINNNSATRSGKRGEWVNCFGNQSVTKGQYKKWEVKIIPKKQIKKAKDGIADVVIGIIDIKKITAKSGGFWLGPSLGYGYYGWNGKKFHTQKKGKNYGGKYSVNDKIGVEINMQRYDLGFYINDVYQGRAFNIDARLSYCLAVALSTPDYDIQIV